MIDSFIGKYRWLSNFHPCKVTHDGILYPSTEHAYQAAKVLDFDMRKAIAKLDSPGKSKKFGAKVALRSGWDDMKLGVMLEVNLIKFAYNQDLREKLLATGDEELVEGNTWGDTYWGAVNGIGQNNLGKILMSVRSVFNGTGIYRTDLERVEDYSVATGSH